MKNLLKGLAIGLTMITSSAYAGCGGTCFLETTTTVVPGKTTYHQVAVGHNVQHIRSNNRQIIGRYGHGSCAVSLYGDAGDTSKKVWSNECSGKTKTVTRHQQGQKVTNSRLNMKAILLSGNSDRPVESDATGLTKTAMQTSAQKFTAVTGGVTNLLGTALNNSGMRDVARLNNQGMLDAAVNRNPDVNINQNVLRNDVKVKNGNKINIANANNNHNVNKNKNKNTQKSVQQTANNFKDGAIVIAANEEVKK